MNKENCMYFQATVICEAQNEKQEYLNQEDEKLIRKARKTTLGQNLNILKGVTKRFPDDQKKQEHLQEQIDKIKIQKE